MRKAMRVLASVSCWAILALLVAAPAAAQSVSDEVGPTVSAVSFSPTSIDTTTGSKNVTVTVTATDDLSGVNYFWIYFRTTATGQAQNQSSVSCSVSSLTSGSRNDGVFSNVCTFPQYIRSGSWYVEQVYAYDIVGNYTPIYNGGNPISVAPQTLSVTAPTYVPPLNAVPELVSLSLAPSSIDTSAAGQSVTLTARITSNTGNFNQGYFELRDPTGGQTIGASVSYWNRISGTANDGIYQTTVYVPRYSRIGPYTWSYAIVYNTDWRYSQYSTLIDGKFKWRYTYDGVTTTVTDLGTSGPTGTPATLAVESIPDTTPPTLVNFDINPSSIDVSTSSKSINVSVALADDLVGAYYTYFQFVSPNGQQTRGNGTYFSSTSPTATLPVFFPQFSQAGNWVLNYFQLCDQLWNCRNLSPAQLIALGFPTGLQISSGLEVQNATGYVGGTVSLTAKLTKLGVAVSGKTITFKVNGTTVGTAITDGGGLAKLEDVSINGIAVGTYVNAITAAFAGDGDVAAASGQATLVVTNKLSQQISFAALPDRQLSQSPFDVSATASSGLTVGFAASGNCTIAGTTVTLTAAGSCTIIASQGGNALYNPAPSVSRTFTILAKSDQTIAFAAIGNKQYGTAPFSVTASSSSGLAVTLAASGNCSVSASQVTVGSVGSCTITASQPGNDSYNAATDVARSFSITAALLTVSADANPSTAVIEPFAKTYDGQVYTPFTVRYDGFQNGDTVSVLTGTLSFSGVGTTATGAGGPYVVTPGGLTAGNYTVTFQSGVLNITQADQTITFAAIADKQYGDPNFNVQATSTSALSVTLQAAGNCSISGIAVTLGSVGSCSITASQVGNTNYKAAQNVVRAFNITKAPLSVIADADPTTATNDVFTKTYNGQVYSPFTVRYEGFRKSDTVSALSGTLAFTGTAVGAINAGGPYTVVPGGLTAGNYEIAFVAGSLSINQASLVVTARDAYKVLNAPLPALEATYSGFVGTEGVGTLGGSLSCVSTATAASPVGNYSITCSGLTSGNYNIQYSPAKLYVQYAAAGAACLGDAGHSILQPIDADNSSVFKKGSTVPAKFRVCDANGISIGEVGVVKSFSLVQILSGTVPDVDEPVVSTTPDSSFRWDPTAQQWIFNISTKPLTANKTYAYLITLNDGTTVRFQFGLR